MSLKNVSLISLIILSLFFVFTLINTYSYIKEFSDVMSIYDIVSTIISDLLWIPFILFFWKIYKG